MSKTKNTKDDNIVFLPEDEKKEVTGQTNPWKILVVDDEESIHVVTKMVLGDFTFMGRGIKIYNAYSTKSAQRIISSEPDIAIILLDVILETPHAGLDFVKYVREKIENNRVRIILRTGQPGESPENEVILQYDINDYKYKTELTEPRLIAVIASSLRSYNAFCQLECNKFELENEVKQRTLQLEKAKDEALKANNAKSNFLAVMSHEIRTPMNSIVGLLELLSETILQDEQKKTLDTIIYTSKSFLSLVNDILDFSKIEAGHLNIEEQEFCPLEIIENIGFAVHSQIISKAVRLSIYVDPNIPEKVWGDAFRIRQIVNNFASNSAKFTNVGEINIRVDLIKNLKEKSIVRFEVSDTGVGISNDAKKKIFSPFFQSEKNFSRIYGGSGLGLSICKNLTQMMNGEIFFESNPDNGSCFAVEIPLKLNKNVRKSIPLKGTKVFAALFGSQAAKNICKYLEIWGADIEIVDDGISFEKNLCQGKDDFDIIFIDMPIISMMDLLEIKNLKSLKDKKIIILPFCNNPPERLENIYVLPSGVIKREEVLSAFTNKTYNKIIKNTKKDSSLSSLDEKYKVLVVDDNPVNRLVITRQMERLGFIAESSSDGSEALASINKKNYDLLLTDCSMPNMNGFELTQKIREKEKCKELPIIAVTANASLEYKQKCMTSGMNDYLLKPFGLDDLRIISKKWLPYFQEKDCLNEDDNKEFILQEISKDSKKAFFNSKAPIDMFRMLGVCKNDFASLPEMLLLFKDSCSASLNMALDAIDNNDAKNIEFYAHKLKSGALVAGASKLADVACEIERAIINKNYGAIKLYRKFLYCSFWEVAYFIDEYIAKNP